jgi:superfamily II DNA or RNA helicase
MKVEKTSTGLIIHQPTDEIKRKCLRYFSLSDPVREYFIYSGKDTKKVPIFGKEHDVIYITSGFLSLNDQAIRQLRPFVHNITSSDGSTVHVTMNRQPRSKLQEDCIHSIITSKSSKITIEVKPGVGKTFMALYAISKLERKPLIVAPTVLLKNQWIENLEDLGIDRSDIATTIYDGPNKTFCVVTISSIENELRKDWKGLMDVIKKANYGIKITDESHLHMKGLLKFDAICNIKRNWYLSATLGRSDEAEDRILNRALSDAERFIGDSRYEEYQEEYINIYLQDIYYNASRKLCETHFKYGKKGLISATYYRMLMDYNFGKPFYRNIIHMVKVADKIKEPGTKVLVLLPLLDAIRTVLDVMGRDPYFKQFDIAMVDGSMSLSEKSKALEKDLILSTTASMGTGVDVSNLGAVINFDQKSSLIIFEQIVGRLRNRGFQTYYFDVCDHVKYAKAFQKWGAKRRQYLPYMPGTSRKMKRLPDIRC